MVLLRAVYHLLVGSMQRTSYEVMHPLEVPSTHTPAASFSCLYRFGKTGKGNRAETAKCQVHAVSTYETCTCLLLLDVTRRAFWWLLLARTNRYHSHRNPQEADGRSVMTLIGSPTRRQVVLRPIRVRASTCGRHTGGVVCWPRALSRDRHVRCRFMGGTRWRGRLVRNESSCLG